MRKKLTKINLPLQQIDKLLFIFCLLIELKRLQDFPQIFSQLKLAFCLFSEFHINENVIEQSSKRNWY